MTSQTKKAPQPRKLNRAARQQLATRVIVIIISVILILSWVLSLVVNI
jgi:hypothetical protein